MANIPQEKTLDSSLALLRDGYTFIQKRCRQFQSDIFQTRLMGEKVICIHGQEAAKIFYDSERFIRRGAVPKRVQKSLLGEKGVQTLDDEAHRHRKALFMSLMTPQNIQQLMELMADQWRIYMAKWEKRDQLILFEEVEDLLCRAACKWAGVPLKESEVRKRAGDFGRMVNAFGAAGPRHWKGRLARQRGEKWIRRIIEQVRGNQLQVPEGTAAYAMAWHRNLDGQLLDTQMAAVELINILRPIVAIATYVTFAVLAMHTYPVYGQKLKSGEDNYVEMFVQEVRRFYPFAPFLGARVRTEFDWKGHRFQKGTLVLLDVYGILHDARIWERPDAFSPERFRDWEGNPFDLIPQGGGDHNSGHRCAGEWITIEAMKLSLTFLTHHIEYVVPEQDLSFSLSNMPTLPKSGFVISHVRRTGKPVPEVSILQTLFT